MGRWGFQKSDEMRGEVLLARFSPWLKTSQHQVFEVPALCRVSQYKHVILHAV